MWPLLCAFISVEQPFAPQPTDGLQGRNIALWASHGRYYDLDQGRWRWQRPQIFGHREDWLTARGFVLPYLIPMLERAGATVYYPRERDTHATEMVLTRPNRPGGSFQIDMPQPGEYAVYVKYAYSPQPQAHLTLNHSGGSAEITLDQTRGYDRWQYVGTYPLGYANGVNSERPTIELSLPCGSERRQQARLEAVKVGGGIGVSSVPRVDEGARYWLEYAGYPAAVYAPLEGENEYKEDIRCRPNWANLLAASPDSAGLGIPLDLALAVHTDAGIADFPWGTIGTLALYHAPQPKAVRRGRGRRRRIVRRAKPTKPSESQKLASEVSESVVEDIRALHYPFWESRGLRNRNYYECSAPKMPSMILEILSHQNRKDMELASDPQFRFDVARGIYKGILRYLALKDDRYYTVAPLPPHALQLSLRGLGKGDYLLQWQATRDKLEATATPSQYIIEVAMPQQPFIPVKRVKGTECNLHLNLRAWQQAQIRVVAENAGGQSLPSAVLVVQRYPDGSDFVFSKYPSTPNYLDYEPTVLFPDYILTRAVPQDF